MSPQLGLPLGWRDGGHYEDFHAGDSNAATLTQLRQILAQEQQAVLLHGPAAAGKTHLLLAAQSASAGARYLGLRRPLAQAVGLLGVGGDERLLCLDDIDAHLGAREFEIALFDRFNRQRDQAGSVLMSACSRPLATAFSLPDLASRVLGATALVLQPLDEAELEQAWTMRARLRGLDPDAAAVRWLLRHQRRDFRSLMQALDRLDETALAAQRRLSLPFVRQCLGEPANVDPIGSDPTAV